MLAWILLFVILAFVGKLIYDVQQNKKKPTQAESEFDVDALQKLAGIKGEKTSSVSLDVLKQKFENTEFPAPDPSIPVITAKLTTIGGDYSDSDPLAQIPMSRVSKEAKQKIAEIAKEDINNQVEKNVSKFEALNGGQKACGCGRSETGFCTGLHRIPKKDWAAGVREIPAEKSKRKYTKRKTSTK